MPEKDGSVEDDGSVGDDSSVEDGGSVEDDALETSADDDHLEDIPDGCGCVEIWEHLERQRAQRE